MRLLFVAALALMMSGCFGVPAGSADLGDQVKFQYIVLDADTRQPIMWGLDNVPSDEDEYNGMALQARVRAALNGTPADLAPFFIPAGNGMESVPKAAFDQAVLNGGHAMALALNGAGTLGTGDTGLGADFERGLIGVQPGETVRIVSRDDASRDFVSKVRADKWVSEPQPIEQTIPRAAFEQNVGTPEVDQVFKFNNLFQAQVVSFDDSEVVADLLVTPGQEFDASIVGGNVVARVTEGMYQFELVLEPGAVFTLQSTPFNPAPLGLPDGTFRSIGTDGDEVVWDHTPVARALVGRDIEFHVTVEEVTPAALELGEDYGTRQSPVRKSTGGSGIPLGDDHGHDHGNDHGHDHGHGHDH